MYGAVAAGAARGGHDTIEAAVDAMARPHARTYRPVAATRATYDRLYDEYVALHDYFGRGENDVMKRLRAIRAESTAGEAPEARPLEPRPA